MTAANTSNTPSTSTADLVELLLPLIQQAQPTATRQTVRDMLRLLPHMLALEVWPAGFVIARYQDGKLAKAEHKAEERIEQEAA